MVGERVTEWTLDGVLDELERIHNTMRDRQFAFILGSGASFTSGIPTGGHLARRWIEDLHLRECADKRTLQEWIPDCGIADGKITLETVAEYYPQIFERRFEGDREAGYAELEAAMEGKSPSLGYSLLAEIIQRTRHKVVVTTNFDNLVADALAMHAHQSPLVVAHESLAGFVRPQLRRPLVAKIHRDLFLHPINDIAGVSTMEQGWRIALKKLFQYFTPIVVGYGGNDGSLMDMLTDLDTDDIAGRMVWCCREDTVLPEKALAVLRKHKGLRVRISGFDDFMLQLAAKLVDDFDVAAIAERTAKLGHERAERYREQAEKLRKESVSGSAANQKAGAVLNESVRSGKSWWAWEMKAQSTVNLEQRNQVYQEGLSLFPNSADLAGSYAIFLAIHRRDYDAAEAMYKKSLELDPSNATHTGNYALFLANQRRDYDAAEAMHQRGLKLDPSNAHRTSTYAAFLANRRKDYDAAEKLFKKALEIDPSHVASVNSYAIFLRNQRYDYDAAETMHKRALELDPSHAGVVGNYALFLENHRPDINAAEAMYKKALELNPNIPGLNVAYANFLATKRNDYGAAETLFKKTLELDPTDAQARYAYANFLATSLQDYKSAETFFRKSLELDPENGSIHGIYAAFLANKRNDYDAAIAMYEKGLELDPSNLNIIANFASALLTRGTDTDLQSVASLVKKVIIESRMRVSQAVAEGLLYGALAQEIMPELKLDDMLARLKGALLTGYPRGSWDFSLMFSAILPRVTPERRDLFIALGKAILNIEDLPPLDLIESWRAILAIDPFSAF